MPLSARQEQNKNIVIAVGFPSRSWCLIGGRENSEAPPLRDEFGDAPDSEPVSWFLDLASREAETSQRVTASTATPSENSSLYRR